MLLCPCAPWAPQSSTPDLTTIDLPTSIAPTKERHRLPAIRSRHLFDFSVILAYLVLGFLAFTPLRPWTSTRLFGAGSDPALSAWFLGWVPHALAHGTNPLFSHALYFPQGLNLAQNGSTPLLGLLTAPLAPLLSPVARGNLVMILAFPVSAAGAFFVLRKWQVWAPAAAIGGLIYGFSPFAIGEGLGHLFLIVLPLPPLIAFTLVSITRRRGRPIILGIQLGVLLGAQFLISAEIFAMIVILLVLVLGCVALRHPTNLVGDDRDLLAPVAAAVGVTGVILAVPVWMILYGAQHFAGPAQGIPNTYFNDVLSFVHPGPLQRVSLGVRAMHVPLSGNAAENGGYVGIPFLFAAICLAWRSRRTSRMQVAVLVTFWAALLSLGTHLAVAGHTTHIPLPFDAVMRLPLADNILPVRFSFATALGLAAVIGFGLDDIRRAPRPRRRGQHIVRATSLDRRWAYAASMATLAALIVSQLPQWPYTSQPVRVLPAQIRSAIPSGDPVAVAYPYPSWLSVEAEVWQLQDGFSFNLMGGYALQPNPLGRASLAPNPTNPPDLSVFLMGLEAREAPSMTSGLVVASRAALLEDGVRVVIVDKSAPGGPSAMALFQDALGRPKVVAGSFALWSSSAGPL